jgi:uncharacterized delta-60 repeat protein/uncharacterized repeat protein (TIGR01451 family)
MKHNGYFCALWRMIFGAVIAWGAWAASSGLASAQNNDNFANAFVLSGPLGTTNGNNNGFTAEPLEPNHAGLAPAHSAWYKWTAPQDGLVTFDTFGSTNDTVLAVYTGTSVGALNFVVANDNICDPANDPQTGGPSLVKFNAQAGQTYYIAVDGAAGAFGLGWSYYSAGVFRFSIDTTSDINFYTAAETEATPDDNSTGPSVTGARVTVTRIGGAAGRAKIDIKTVPAPKLARGFAPAAAGTDYTAVSNTLMFDDWEMSKSIIIPINYDSGTPASNRMFAVTISVNTNRDGEPSYILAPRIDPRHATARVGILDFDRDPQSPAKNPVAPAFTNGAPSVVNLLHKNYRVTENAGFITIWAYRVAPSWVPPGGTPGDPANTATIEWVLDGMPGSEGQDNQFPLQAGSDYATPSPSTLSPPGLFPDFVGVVNNSGVLSGTVSWGPGDYNPKPITIFIGDDPIPEFNEDFTLSLFQVDADSYPGNIDSATVTILFDDYPAGALDTAYNPDYDIMTDPPGNTVPGANYQVNATALQPDGKCLLAGDFSTYNAVPRNRIARANVDGSHDATFDPGSGANDFISCMVLVSSNFVNAGHIVIGGGFTSFNGQSRYHVARLNGDGSLDTTFNPGLGADDNVWAVAVQSDGKTLIGGDFLTVNGQNRPFLARLNSDGSVDATFDTSLTPLNGTVQAIVVSPDGTIYIGGDFTMVGGTSRNRIARLKADGSLDATFDPRTGVDGTIFTLALQPDHRLLLGGSFATVDLRVRHGLARLNSDGTLDTTFGAGQGANDSVYAMTLQSDGLIYIAGQFTSFNQTRRVGIARLFADGTVDTSFIDTAYNQYAGVQNPPFYTEGPSPQNAKSYVLSLALQGDGGLIIAGNFHEVGGGRLLSQINTNLLDIEDTYSGFSRAAYRNRENIARLLGGATDGAGNISLVNDNYFIDESSQFIYIKARRENGSLGRLEAPFSIPQPGTGTAIAQPTLDYSFNGVNTRFDSAWSSARALAIGIYGTNNNSTSDLGAIGTPAQDIFINIPHRQGVQGNRTAALQFDVPSCSDVFYLGGEDIPLGGALGARTTASLQINEVDNLPGVISLSSASYQVNENVGSAVITLIRTNGSAGTVSVIINTTNGTAISGVDYNGITNTVTFLQGQTNKTVSVPIINNSIIQPDRTLKLIVHNPTGGASVGVGQADLTIIDDDYLPGHLTLSSSNYTVGEYAGSLSVAVNRKGGSLGLQDVDVLTFNGSAVAGMNFVAVSNRLHWNNGESGLRTVNIPLLPDGLVTSNLQFSVRLANPSDPNSLQFSQTNSLVTIVNGDSYGNPQFAFTNYPVAETAGSTTITVVRTGGSAETVSVNYSTGDPADSASATGPLPNYVATSGTLIFGPGVVSQSFTVPILNDGVIDPNPLFFSVKLSGVTPAGAALGSITKALVVITDAQTYNQPAGSVDPAFNAGIGFNSDVYALVPQTNGNFIVGGAFTTVNGLPRNRFARIFPNGAEDTTFMAGLSAANDTVRAVLGLSDSRLMVGGYFTIFNGVNRNRLTRLNTDGSLDTTFDPGSGADATVFAFGEGFSNGLRKMYVGGSFTTFNGFARPGLVRLNDDGSVDSTFALTTGVNGPVYAIAVCPTNTLNAGKIVIGGAFTAVNGVPCSNIARLNTDGSLDTTFNPGAGADGEVRALALQLDGKVLLGGAFTNVAGQARSRLARLNTDGSLDLAFNVGSGANGTVFALALQADTRIVVGGDFTQASGVTRRRITRLMPDGTVDPSINFGAGADGFVAALAVQTDGNLVLGGGFSSIDGQPRNGVARLFGGSMTGSGQIEFSSAFYQVDENGTNAVITFRRVGGTSGPNPDGSGSVSLNFATSDNTAVAGVNYTAVSQPIVFPVGEVEASALVPVQQDFQITPTLIANLTLSGTPSLMGPQPIATLEIANVDSSVRFSAATYVRNEDAIDGVATIDVVREGSTSGISTIQFATTTNGTAVPGVNYIPTNASVVFQPGDTHQSVRVPVLHNPLAEPDKTVTMALTLPQNTILLTPNQAVLTIQNVDLAPGQFVFSAPAYSVSEGAGSALITVLRTNGFTGIVSVNIATAPGSAAPGVRYFPTNGVLTFADGQQSRTFAVTIIDDNIVNGDQDFNVVLSSPNGGATIGMPSQVPVTIIDNDVALNFTSPAYVVSETNNLALVGVQRLNGTNGVSTVTFQTVNGTALAGTNFVADSRVLTFNPGETLKTVGVGILRDPRVTGNLSFSVLLTNASPGVQLPPPNPATVTIIDVDAGFHFTNSVFTVLESATNLFVTVIRDNATSGDVTVNYATSDGTALAGQDYVATSGTLTFLNGETVKTIAVPIIDNKIPQPSRSFGISLFNPSTGAQLLNPSSATATILDDDSAIRFSADIYRVIESGVFATITVLRTNYTDSVVTVDYATENGSAVAGVDFTGTSGTLIFTNGETSKTFTIGLHDDTIVQGDRTAQIKLFNVTGNASLVSPSVATLYIADDDGSHVIPAGTALVSDANNNSIIDPGETVTVLFGFRNTGGTNTPNVTATLLATNGVTPVTTTQAYGLMPVGGHVVSQPFTFTANATNGQTIIATFLLRDNGNVIGTGLFSFGVGTTTVTVTNGAPIIITDRGASPDPVGATPYPATITVGGVDGTISKLTVGISNLTHMSASDVDMLLVSPAGQKTLFMANAGGFNALNNVNLNFDDAAGASLPLGSAFGSGSYKPTSYAPLPPFPVPAPPPAYSNSLAAFNGINPNGTWSLYVIDDTSPGAGVISNGWSLAITRASSVPAAADLSLGMTASSDPAIAGAPLTYVLNVTNYGPATATAVSVADTLPPGAQFVSATTATGSATNQNGVVTWSLGSLANGASATLSLVIVPTMAGSTTNTALATSAVSDVYMANNTATTISQVTTPNADLVMLMSDSPDPVAVGWPLTYLLQVTNLGPAAATGVTLTNTLPPAVSFVSVTASQGSAGNSAGTIWASLGTLNPGASATVTLVVVPNLVGTVTNTAFTVSAVIDPLKANNTASLKSTVIPQLQARLNGSGGITLTTPGLPGSVLDTTASLTSPVVWTPILTNPPTVVNLPIGAGNQFFRLRPAGP